MALSITDLMAELKIDVGWQATPYPILDNDYFMMIKRGIRRLFVDTNRPEAYDESLIIETVNEPETEGDPVTKTIIYNMDLNIIEQEYILLVSKIAFFKRVQTDVNDKFSYSTDALKVTNADKPYANLKDTLSGLENDRRIIYYKMTDYTLGNGA